MSRVCVRKQTQLRPLIYYALAGDYISMNQHRVLTSLLSFLNVQHVQLSASEDAQFNLQVNIEFNRTPITALVLLSLKMLPGR